jgi:hypothetical protein
MQLALRKLGPTTTAALLVLAIIVAPLCKTLCASPGSCPAHSFAAKSASDTCHHATLSTASDDPAPALASGAICAQPEIAAIVAGSDSTRMAQRLDRTSTPLNSSLIAASSDATQTRTKDAALSGSSETPAPSDPRLRTTILQL